MDILKLIDGTYKFQIDRQELFAVLNMSFATVLILDVNVTETLTGNTLSDTKELTYTTRREKIAFLVGANNFKPGLRYRTYVLLTDQNDRPLTTENAEINFSARLTSDSNSEINRQVNKTVSVRKNGLAPFTLRVPLQIDSMTITASYGDLETTKFVAQFQSPSDTYIQVQLRSRSPKAGWKARFQITSTRPNKRVKYLVFSRGSIWHSGEVHMEKRKALIAVPMTADMAPACRILVFYIKNNAEIVADSVKFNVQGVFENEVKLRFTRRTVKPGKEVSLVVKADPGSQCNVLAVDKSILLLKKGNDITSDMVEDEILTYDTISHASCGNVPCMDKYFSEPIRGADVYSIFRESGLYAMTNGVLYRYYPPRRSSFSHTWSSSTMMMMTSMMTTTTFPASMTMASMAPSMSTPLEENEDNQQQQQQQTPPKVRSLFPDTWIYSNSVTANSAGKCLIKATVPDTITSWVATAFAVHNTTGLGVAPEPANLEVFLKFFIRLELPYSVTRGEQLILQASVFNFFTKDLEVDVLLKKSECFDNIVVDRTNNGTSILSYSREDVYRQVTITADKAVTLSFPIKPTELGNCEIEIQAITASVSDAVKRDLLVKAEGIEEYYNIPILLEVDDDNDFFLEQPVTLPEDLVPDSAKIRIAVVGDLMGPSITGLTSLLKMPYGCGEQNMISFVPNIFVIQYLEAINNLKPTDLENGKQFMTIGYQRELTYQHPDGSFSAFGTRDLSGSTWLTSFVVKSLAQASPYIYIDRKNMDKTINWLLGQYDNRLGIFREPGRVNNKAMQGSSASGVSVMASFIVISLLEAQKAGFGTEVDSYMSLVIDDAIETLENNLDNTTDVFELAIMSYAFALAGSNKLNEVLAILEESAIETDGMKYWEAQKDIDNSNVAWYQARPKNVETNAYILLTYVLQRDLENSLQIMRWMIKQRNSFGGYRSTQDTVLGLQALADVAAMVFSPYYDITLDITGDSEGFSHTFEVNSANSLLFQTVYPPTSTRLLTIQATGTGVALLQISVTYNVMEDPLEPLFSLLPSFTDETLDGFRLSACFNYLGEGISGMVVMEIGMLSGFLADRFSVTSLGILKRVEEEDNILVLYFDEVTPDMECIEVQMKRTGLVAGSQPAVIKLYDYYDPKNHIINLYQPKILQDSDVCDIGSREIGC